MRLDSHQHFWKFNSDEYDWMTDEMDELKRDYLPPDLAPLLKSIEFDGTIAVQARQLLQETEWLLELSNQYDLIKGVVGWVDLRSDAINQQLEKYSQHPRLVGVRHVVHDEPDDNFVLGEAFQNGISKLKQYNLTFDLLLFPRHLSPSIKLVSHFPEQPFVIDHISKPNIAEQVTSGWEEDMRTIAGFPNVYCKLSGMVTETTWKQWKPSDFHKYLDIIIEAFGTGRVMIGSDWPVCILSGEYQPVMEIVIDYIEQFSSDVKENILGGNCAKFYSIG